VDIARRMKKTGALLLFDFEKAFDRLDRDFLFQTLNKMKCGDGFLIAIVRLHSDNESTVLVNGFPTNWFSVDSGVRQGCPIAPLLYAISTEPLRSMMEMDSSFSGLVIGDIRLTVQMYADDTNGFAGNVDDVKRIHKCFQIHEEATAAKLNISKCSSIIIGGMTEADLVPFKVLKGKEYEWLLGVPFGPKNTDEVAMQRIREKFTRKMEIWRDWPLSIFGRTLVANSSMLSHIWRASQFIPDIGEKSIWSIYHSEYWSYVQPGNFKGRFRYQIATNKRKEGGLGAIEPLLEIQALKAHWMVRMLANRGQSWADLMWMEFESIAKKYNIKNPMKAKSWKTSDLEVKSIMEDVIKCWIKCNIRIETDDNEELKWVAEDGSLKSLSLLRVKTLYKRLSKKGDELGKNKFWINITDNEWKARWEYFANQKHLGPLDKQLRFRIHQAKLWCGTNRGSKQAPNPKCPVCGELEMEVDHALTTKCGFTKAFFLQLQRKWKGWTGNLWSESKWNSDWIKESTSHRNQMDLVMTTAKRIIWHNYTNAIFTGSSIGLVGLASKCMGALRYKIKASTWMCNSTEDKNIDGWDLAGIWASFEDDHWTIIEDSFTLSIS
jgi:hypothetical protein